MPVILMNQNNHNICIWQPLLAAEIYAVEHLPWDYGVEFQHHGDSVEVAFQPIPPADIVATVKSVHDEPDVQSHQLNLAPHLDPIPIIVQQILISSRMWNVSL